MANFLHEHFNRKSKKVSRNRKNTEFKKYLKWFKDIFFDVSSNVNINGIYKLFYLLYFLINIFLFCFTISYFVARFRHFYISTQGIEFTFCWLTAFDFNFMTPIYKCTFFMNQFLHIEITIKRLAIQNLRKIKHISQENRYWFIDEFTTFNFIFNPNYYYNFQFCAISWLHI